MAKTLRVLSVTGDYRLIEQAMSPTGRTIYAFSTSLTPAYRWARMNQSPTGSQPTQGYTPLPSNGGYGSGWSRDGKYHLLFTNTVNIYLNSGANSNMTRVFNDTPLNVFGEEFYPRTVSWFADDYYFWVSGSSTASINTVGCLKAFLCYYNPVANTITVLDSFTTAANISMLSLSPCNRWIASRQGNSLIVHRILPNRRLGTELLNLFTNTHRAFAWHPSGNYLAQKYSTGIRIYGINASGATLITGSVSDRPVFGWLNGGRTFVTLTMTSTVTAYDFNPATGAVSAWSGATVPSINAIAKPDYANALVRESSDVYGSIMLIQHDANTSQLLIASESNDSRIRLTAPVATFAGSTGTPNNASVEMTGFAPTGDFRANRNEYLTMDAESFAASFDGEFSSLYGSAEMSAPVAVMDNRVVILDEPYEPFEYRQYLSPAFHRVIGPAGLVVRSEASDPFAYGKFLALLPVIDALGTQGVDVTLEASFEASRLSGSFGHVPDFEGDFVSFESTFQAFAPLYPEGFGDFVAPVASMNIEGSVPSDVAILNATSFLPEIAAEAISPPAGMLDASVPFASVEASGIVPVGAFMEASVDAAIFDGETFAPIGGFGEFVAGVSLFEASGNVTTGAFLVAETSVPFTEGLVNVPQLANGEFTAPQAEFDSFTGVGSEMALDAVAPVARTSVDAIFMYDAVLEASAMVPIFEGLPPEPVDVEGDFVATEASVDVFGGPWILADAEPVGHAAEFEGALLKAGQIDANMRSHRSVFDGFANIQVTGVIDMLAEPTIVDIFAGQTVEASVEMFAPMAEANIRARFGEPADGDTFVTTYHKKRRHGKAFSPIHARF